MVRKHKMPFTVEIKKSLCVACDRCVETCKNNNFRKTEDGKMEVIPEYKCNGCYKCYDGCLTKAIKVLVSGGGFFSR